jgi:hypothetical protein
MEIARDDLPKYTIEELNAILSVRGRRLAYSTGELAELLGMNKRRLTQLLDQKGVPTFMLGNRRMVREHTVRRILQGKLDVGKPPVRERDEGGVFVEAGSQTA